MKEKEKEKEKVTEKEKEKRTAASDASQPTQRMDPEELFIR